MVDGRRLPTHQTLRKIGETLAMTIPREFIDRNGLAEGSHVELHFAGSRMIVEVAARPRYTAADPMQEMSEGFPRAEGGGMPSIGVESGGGAMSSVATRLSHFAASQKNIDWLAIRLFVCVAVVCLLVVIATVVAMHRK
jgi:antitoxin component of MazEF toxin-antitoxin module